MISVMSYSHLIMDLSHFTPARETSSPALCAAEGHAALLTCSAAPPQITLPSEINYCL